MIQYLSSKHILPVASGCLVEHEGIGHGAYPYVCALEQLKNWFGKELEVRNILIMACLSA